MSIWLLPRGLGWGELLSRILLFKVRAMGNPQPGVGPILDPSYKRMMVYVFVGTRGGHNRSRIVELLKVEPSNPNKISEKLSLDYKTVQHHLKMLEDNEVIVASAKETYGAVYFLTPFFERHFDTVKAMWVRFGQS